MAKCFQRADAGVICHPIVTGPGRARRWAGTGEQEITESEAGGVG